MCAISFQQEMFFEQRSEWVSAMDREIESLSERKVWMLLMLPNERKSVRTKWIFNINSYGNDEKTR